MSNHSVHRKHPHQVLPTGHIHNVSYLLTHDLLECSCGFFGWVQRTDS